MQDVAIRNGPYWSFFEFLFVWTYAFGISNMQFVSSCFSGNQAHDLGVASAILYGLSYRNVFIFMKYITYTLYFNLNPGIEL